jgi:hypothetical protein
MDFKAGINRLVSFFKKHYLGIILALLFGIFSAGPQLLFLYRAGEDFKGIYGEFNGDALLYLARIREVLDGYWSVSNPYFLEHKGDVFPQASLPEIMVAGISKLTHLSPPQLQVRLDFILPALLFFLTYLLFYSFSKSSLVSAGTSILFYFISLGPLNKPIHPQISFFFLLSFLYLFYNFAIKDRKLVWALFSGINLGLLFNIYLYHWSFLLVFLGLYFLIIFLQKRYREVKFFFVILIPAIIIGLPYFFTFYLSTFNPNYHETAVRVGLYLTHWVESFPRLAVALMWLALFLFFSWKLKLFKTKECPFFLSLLLANIIYPNQQIITGRILQFAVHWSWMPIFIYCLSTCYLFRVIKESSMGFKHRNLLIIILIISVLFPPFRLLSFTWHKTLNLFSENTSRTFLQYQKFAPIFEWLNSNTKKDEVVYSNSIISRFVPAYTHNNVLHTRYNEYFASDKEIVERFLIFNFLNRRILNQDNFGIELGNQLLWKFAGGSEYNTHYIHRLLGIPYEEKYSPKKEVEFIKGIFQEIQNQDFLSLLKKYHVSYFVWDEGADPQWRLNEINWLEKVFENGDVSIWKIIN